MLTFSGVSVHTINIIKNRSFYQIESVELAMQLLDGMEVRNGHKMSIEAAQFQLKGDYDVSKKPKMLSKKEKKKLHKEQEK